VLLGRRAFTRSAQPNVLPASPGGRKFRALAQLASVGIELSVSTIVGMLGGRWLDDKLGSAPWLMLLGLVLGVSAGMRSLIRTARKANREGQTSEPTQPPEAP
jgi:ATP synthase protein I